MNSRKRSFLNGLWQWNKKHISVGMQGFKLEKKSGSPLGHIASSQRELPEPHEAVLWLRGSVDPKKIDEIAMEKEKWSVFFTNSFGCDGASH